MTGFVMIPFWIAFGVSAIVAWPIYRLLLLTKSRQTIDPHAPETHRAKQGTPTMGGLIIVFGAAVAMLLRPISAGPEEGIFRTQFNAAFVLLLGFAAIGFLDDFVVPRVWGKRGLGWKPKILLEVIFAVWAATIMHPDGGGTWWLSVFLILFFANAFNFADGLDGLAGSLWLGLAIGIIAIDPLASGTLAAILSGGVVAFLILNAPPAKVFMGDVGSLPVGALLGLSVDPLLSGWGVFDKRAIIPVLLLSVVMIAELVPVPLQVAYYKLTKGKRLFPMTPIHHAFEKKGWPESKVVWTFALVQLLLSLAAATVYLLSYGGR